MDSLPITTVLKIKPKPGMEKKCLQWMDETASVASQFSGFINKEICRTVNGDYIVTIFSFQTRNELQQWENSHARKQQTIRGEFLFENNIEKGQLVGLEFWFQSSAAQPPKWKIIIVTVLVIFALLNTLVPLLQNGFTSLGFHPIAKSFFGVLIMVCLMTYWIMPATSRLLRAWLAKK